MPIRCPVLWILPFLILLHTAGLCLEPVKIGVLSQADFPKFGAPSDPAYFAELIKQAGAIPIMLSADDLLNTGTLDARTMPVVVLPYGPVFPGEAERNWKRYLHEGGNFFSTGGYAFDEPVYRRDGKWLTWRQLTALDPPWLADGAFGKRGAWKVTGDAGAACFGPDPNLAGKPGLTLGYPYETGFKTGGKRATVTVSQTFEAPPAGHYEVSYLRYARWLKGTGNCSITLTTRDGQGQAIKRFDLEGWSETQGAALLPTQVQFEVAPATRRVELSLTYNQLAGTVGVSEMKIYRWPAGRMMNSHFGSRTDGMTVAEDCVNVFDASFPLRYAAGAVAAPNQAVAPPPLKFDGPLEGWVADAMVADFSRLQPVLKAHDRFGRPRGAVGSIVYHWGRYYDKSNWAIFGVTNRDLFARGDKAMARVFTQTIDRLVRRIYLYNAHAQWPSYRDGGTTIALAVTALNKGAEPRSVTIRMSVHNEAGQEEFSQARTNLIQPGGLAEAQWHFIPKRPLAGGFHRIVADLELGGKLYDRIESGFFVWDESLVTAGPQYTLEDNVFKVNGRPTYMPGVQMHNTHLIRWMDGPLRWYEDARAMRDFGLLQYQTLDYWTPWRHTPGISREQWRQSVFFAADGRTMASRMAGLQHVPCQTLAHDMAQAGRLTDGGQPLPEAPYDQRIQEAAQAATDFFSRLNYPKAIQYDLGQDVFIDWKDNTWELEEWNKFLKRKYGDGEALRKAWGTELKGEPFKETDIAFGGGGWASRRALDLSDFARWMEENYIRQVGGATRKAAPGGVLTIEYQHQPAGYTFDRRFFVDAWPGQSLLDISSVMTAAYRLGVNDDLKYPDLSLIGKPTTIGEWGNLIHPGIARYGGGLTEREGDECFLNQNCQMFGIGAVQARQWSWRDVSGSENWIFDWGAMHSQDYVPKEVSRLVRCLYLLFRMPELKYEVQPVALVIPTSHKRGNSSASMAQVMRNANKLMGTARVDYAPIAEDCLEQLPKGVCALVWPMPYCPSDAIVGKIESFVRAGGALYLSGDVRYHEDRTLTRLDRLLKLCGVKVTSEMTPGPDFPSPPRVAAAGAAWQDPFWVNRLGKGMVCYLPRNLEETPLNSGQLQAEGWRNPPRTDTALADCAKVYRSFFDLAGMESLIRGGTPETRCWIRHTADGGIFYVLFNGEAFGKPVELRLPTAAGEFKLRVPPARPSMVWVDGQKRVRAVMAEGKVELNGQSLFEMDKMTVLATLVPEDVRRSKTLVVLPLWSGRVRLPESAGKNAIMGEIHDGKWRALEKRGIETHQLFFSPEQAREFTVVSDEAGLDRAVAQVEAWIMRPWEAVSASIQ